MRTEKRKYKMRLIRGVLSSKVSLTLGDQVIGYVLLNNYDLIGFDISLGYIHVDAEYRKKGYASKMMNFVVKLCLKKGAGLKIDVNRAGSEEDDPLVFYQKFFQEKNISVTKDGVYYFLKDQCQCTLKVSLDAMIAATYSLEYKESGLKGIQFLASYLYELDEKQVSNDWFKKEHYMALRKGLKYEQIKNADPSVLTPVISGVVPKRFVKYIKSFNSPQLKLLEYITDKERLKRETYLIITTLPADKITTWISKVDEFHASKMDDCGWMEYPKEYIPKAIVEIQKEIEEIPDLSLPPLESDSSDDEPYELAEQPASIGYLAAQHILETLFNTMATSEAKFNESSDDELPPLEDDLLELGPAEQPSSIGYFAVQNTSEAKPEPKNRCGCERVTGYIFTLFQTVQLSFQQAKKESLALIEFKRS